MIGLDETAQPTGQPSHDVVVLVLSGPSGSGKTTVGRALAASLGWSFLDADDLHPVANVSKMSRGEPLSDLDRAPWLAAIREAVSQRLATGLPTVLACSALRAFYRRVIAGGDAAVRFVLLDVGAEVLMKRVASRRNHFMPASLVPSQVSTLEHGPDVTCVDASKPVDEVAAIVRRLLAL